MSAPISLMNAPISLMNASLRPGSVPNRAVQNRRGAKDCERESRAAVFPLANLASWPLCLVLSGV
jgi:hypothetical protein